MIYKITISITNQMQRFETSNILAMLHPCTCKTCTSEWFILHHHFHIYVPDIFLALSHRNKARYDSRTHTIESVHAQLHIIFRLKPNKKRHVYRFCSVSLVVIRGISTTQIPLCDGFIWWCTGVGANPDVILRQSFWANPYKTLFHFLKRDDAANIHSHNNNDAYRITSIILFVFL